MMNNRIVFSQIFQTMQQRHVAGSCEEMVFIGELPNGYIGFLNSIASSAHPNVLWTWYIDDEKIESIPSAIGDIRQPVLFNPPYLVKKKVEVRCRNNNEESLTMDVFCNGECYPLPEPLALQPIRQNQTNELLTDIKTELQSVKPVGEVTDEYITVTDTVYELYDIPNHGLHWTTCSIMNRGPNDVYVAVNEWKRPDAPLLVGESMSIDLSKRGSIKRIYFVCDSGERAVVRVHAIK